MRIINISMIYLFVTAHLVVLANKLQGYEKINDLLANFIYEIFILRNDFDWIIFGIYFLFVMKMNRKK